MREYFRNRKAVGIAAVVFFVALITVIPAFTQEPYTILILTMCMLWAGVASSWNLIAGYAGIFTLGHQALFGLGAYVSSIFAMKLGITPWVSIFIGALFAAVIGALISVPSLKLRLMPYIAIATLGLGEIIRIVVLNTVDLTKGAAGLWGIPPFTPIGDISFDGVSRIPSYYLMLVMFLATIAITAKIVRSPIGKSLSAIKDSQDAAESLGVNVRFNKVVVFMIGSFFAGLFGGFYAHTLLILTPNAVMGGQLGLQIIAYGLVGGMGTIAGPVIGGFVITIGMELLRFMEDYRLIVYALIIILVVIFMRGGIWGTVKPLLDKLWKKN